MVKENFKLSEFKRIPNSSLKNKFVLDDVIIDLDLSEKNVFNLELKNCIIKLVGFSCSILTNVKFENCKIIKTSFQKATLENISFYNCFFEDVNFARSELLEIKFPSCRLNCTYFSDAELTDIQFNNSQLTKVSFSRSLLDEVKITNSILRDINYFNAELYQTSYIDGTLTATPIRINNFKNFLSATNFKMSNSNQVVVNNITDQKILVRVVVFFIILSLIIYCLLKPGFITLF